LDLHDTAIGLAAMENLVV